MTRFASEVEAVLRTAGWAPGRTVPPAAVAAMHRVVAGRTGQYGGRLTRPGAADPVLAEFGGLTVQSDLSGVELEPRMFTIDPTLAGQWTEALIDAGRAMGVDIYPLGVEGLDDAVIAITDLGSVIAVDPVGEWFLGGTIEAALDLLITGRRPRPLLPSDGRQPPPWQPSPPGEMAGAGSLKRPVAAAFFLPRTPANLHYLWLPDALVRIGIVPTASPVNAGRFEVDEWGGLYGEVHVLDLEWYTVLVLTFELNALLAQQPQRWPDPPESLPPMTALARAFRLACAGLAPELEVAFVQDLPVPDLLQMVADREYEVVTIDGAELLDQGFELLYLTDRMDYQVQPALVAQPHEELPISGGRLFRRLGPDSSALADLA